MFMKETPRLNPSPWGGKQSVIAILFILNLLATITPAADLVRERLSFDSDWRFAKDDPSGTGDSLSYTNIKPWVTATGNEFVSDDKPATRPTGNPGANVAYTQSGFDDSAWRQLNLPHDWGIEGPFFGRLRAKPVSCLGKASAGIANISPFPLRTRIAASTSKWMARCPTRTSGSMANTSAAGPTAIASCDSI